jgi:hypothetical protein
MSDPVLDNLSDSELEKLTNPNAPEPAPKVPERKPETDIRLAKTVIDPHLPHLSSEDTSPNSEGAGDSRHVPRGIVSRYEASRFFAHKAGEALSRVMPKQAPTRREKRRAGL